MLEWLKNILGDNYTEDIDKKVSAEIGKGFVSKADFNELNGVKKKLEGDVKAYEKDLNDLKNSNGDISTLKATIEQLQKDKKSDKEAYEKELATIRLNNAVETALTAAGAKNNTAAKALLADFVKDAKAEEDGTVKGLAEQIKSLASADATAFLFDSKSSGMQGMNLENKGDNPPPAAGTDTYETRLADARKSGNAAAVVAIKREAAENGVYLM